MPKDRSDYRAARAALSAPYPLPIIITRAQGERIPTPSPEIVSSATPRPSPAPDYNADEIIYVDGFPYNPRWRERQPAIEPIPYPPADPAERETRKIRREWKLRLRRERRRKNGGGAAEGEEGDGELLMSGIEEGPSNEGLQVNRMGSLSFNSRPSATQTTNLGLLHAPMEANLNRNFFDATPVQPELAFGEHGLLAAPAQIEAPAPDIGALHTFDLAIPAQSGTSSDQVSEYLRNNSIFSTCASAGSSPPYLEDASPASSKIITPEDRDLKRRYQLHSHAHPLRSSPIIRDLNADTPASVYESDAESNWSSHPRKRRITYRIPRSRGARHRAHAEEEERLRMLYRPPSPSSASDDTVTLRRPMKGKGKEREVPATPSSRLQNITHLHHDDKIFCDPGLPPQRQIGASKFRKASSRQPQTQPAPVGQSTGQSLGTPTPSLPLNLERLIDFDTNPLTPRRPWGLAQVQQLGSSSTQSPAGFPAPLRSAGLGGFTGLNGLRLFRFDQHPLSALSGRLQQTQGQRGPDEREKQEEQEESEDPWTPMHVDPRTGDLAQPSWPHPIGLGSPSGFTHHLYSLAHGSPGYDGTFNAINKFGDRCDEKGPCPVESTILMPPPPTPLQGTTRGLTLPSAPPSRPSQLPPAKACHNFLLAKRVNGIRRAKQLKTWNRAVGTRQATSPLKMATDSNANHRISRPPGSPKETRAGEDDQLKRPFHSPTMLRATYSRAQTEPPICMPGPSMNADWLRHQLSMGGVSQHSLPRDTFGSPQQPQRPVFAGGSSGIPQQVTGSCPQHDIATRPFHRASSEQLHAPAPMPLTQPHWINAFSSPYRPVSFSKDFAQGPSKPLSPTAIQPAMTRRQALPTLAEEWESNEEGSERSVYSEYSEGTDRSRKRRREAWADGDDEMSHFDNENENGHVFAGDAHLASGEQFDADPDVDVDIDLNDVDQDIDGQSIFSSIEISFQNGMDHSLHQPKRRRGQYSIHEMSALNLLLGHAGYLGRELKEEEKELRRKEWLIEDRQRAEEQDRLSKMLRGREEEEEARRRKRDKRA